MLKRQDSQLSSSSWRETPLPQNHKAKSVGCVSTIFHLLSKYQNRRKFITFGKKHEKKSSERSTTKAKKALLVDKQVSLKDKVTTSNNKEGEINCDTVIDHRRLSCEVPRSPTLKPEIRQSNSVNSSESFKPRSPTLVARLMGLEEVQCRTKKFDKGFSSSLASCGSTSEKRRKLLGVLEKCDQDLKMLKRVIETARSVEHIRLPALKEGCAGFNNERCRSFLGSHEFSDQLQYWTSYSKKRINGRTPQQRQQNYTLTKKPGENDVVDLSFFDRIKADAFQHQYKSAASSTWWRSKAMIESINEVCKDIEWGEKREIGRIGLVLQDHICRDLIEEIVMEFEYFFPFYSLPFEKCKRRLCF